jgi:hypothetical protein
MSQLSLLIAKFSLPSMAVPLSQPEIGEAQMADLTNIEKRNLERLLGMGSGYVLDFSNRTFEEFVLDSIGKSIYAGEYETGGGSKANRLRALAS